MVAQHMHLGLPKGRISKRHARRTHGNNRGNGNTGWHIQRAVYIRFLSLNLPIGKLTVRVRESLEANLDGNGEAFSEGLNNTLCYEIEFIPPSWLSTSILKVIYEAQTSQGLTNSNRNLSFGMRNYNSDPQLGQYLDEGNIEGLKDLFRQGRARPTDYLPDGQPLLAVSLPSNLGNREVLIPPACNCPPKVET